jgi:nitroreductase
MTKFENRDSTFPIDELLLSRVSSRAFSQERLEEEELMSLFEAARWAPSSYNSQPWRFIYARREDKEWHILFDALVEFNKSWCKDADTLVLVISRKFFEMNNKLSKTASFDAGSSWMSLAIEANKRNIIAHGMSGFDYDKLQKELSIPDSYIVEAMIAIGKKGSKDRLSNELKEMEKPSERKPLHEIISRGSFSF